MVLGIGLTGCDDSAGGVNVWDAVRANNPGKLETFAKAGGDVNVQKWNGVTPLFVALSEEKPQSYKKLLELGADPNIVASEGRVVVNHAAGTKDSFWLQLALEHGGDPNLRNEAADVNKRGTPLYFAIHMGSFENIKLLMEHGADINTVNEFGETPLSEAMGTARFDVVLYLLEQGADYNQPHPRDPLQSFLGLARSRQLEWYCDPEQQRRLTEVWQWLEERGVDLDRPGGKLDPEQDE